MDTITVRDGDVLGHKNHAEGGAHFLLDTNPAPTREYYGFKALSDIQLASITHDASYDDEYTYSSGGNITQITFKAGEYIPIRFLTMTLTSGSAMLFKRVKIKTWK